MVGSPLVGMDSPRGGAEQAGVDLTMAELDGLEAESPKMVEKPATSNDSSSTQNEAGDPSMIESMEDVQTTASSRKLDASEEEVEFPASLVDPSMIESMEDV